MMFVVSRLRRILARGLVGSLRLSRCRSSNDLSFLDWLRGHDELRQERCLRAQMTKARQ